MRAAKRHRCGQKGKITMLFYTSIFVVSLMTAFYARLLYTANSFIYRSVHTSNKRVAITDRSGKYQKERTDCKINNDLAILSVQEGGLVSSKLGKKPPAEPVACHDQNIARLIREIKLLAMYESYKTRCREESEPRTLEMVSKPFRRNADPCEKENKLQSDP